MLDDVDSSAPTFLPPSSLNVLWHEHRHALFGAYVTLLPLIGCLSYKQSPAGKVKIVFLQLILSWKHANFLLTKMPATSEIHTEVLSKEDGCEREEKPQLAAEKKKSVGFFCDEQGYLDLAEHIIQHGRLKGDRTNTGVQSVFGAQVRYSLRGTVYCLMCVISTGDKGAIKSGLCRSPRHIYSLTY